MGTKKEPIDSFGIPLFELRKTYSLDAREFTLRAKQELDRALDELRDIQSEYSGNEKILGTVKSAINALMDTQKHLITATHRIENLVHQMNKKVEENINLMESEIEVSFKHPVFGSCIALFEVEGKLRHEPDTSRSWEYEPQIELLAIWKEDDPKEENIKKEVNFSAPELEDLENQALEKFADQAE